MEPATSPFAKAVHWYRQQADAAGDTPLPSVRQAARILSLSHLTVWRAVQALKTEGVLSVEQGRRIRSQRVSVSGGVHREQPGTGTRRKWRTALERIERDLRLRHTRSPFSLPSGKELARLCGVSYPTVLRALRSLEQRKLIERRGRGYRVTTAASGGRGAGAVVFTGEHYIDHSWPKSIELLKLTDEECNRCGVRCVPARFHEGLYLDPPETWRASPPLTGPILGYVICGIGCADAAALVRRFAGKGLPVSVWNEGWWTPSGEGGSELGRLAHGTTALFDSVDSFAAGVSIGEYLLGLGHRRVAFISPFQGSAWAINRLYGVQTAFDRAGCAEGVICYTDNAYASIWNAAETAMQTHDFPAIIRENTPLGLASPSLGSDIDKAAIVLRTVMAKNAVRTACTPLFEQARACPGVSAWICIEDITGVLALRWLRGQGVRVPAELSVVAFDNTLDAITEGLTSYSFDIPGLAAMMVRHVLAPDDPLFGLSPRVFSTRGWVVERNSSRHRTL